MSAQTDQAVARLRGLFGLPESVATRAVAEVLDCFSLQVDDYIRQRHSTLQQEGLANEAIFERIVGELPGERFVAPPYTARQLRRRVYG